MGATYCCNSFCSGEGENNNIQKTTKVGFTDQIQRIIDSIRQLYKNQVQHMKIYNLPQGKIFKGRLQDSKKSGYGQLYNGSNAFFGQFINDLPDGQGLLVKDYKYYIRGYFTKGKPNGQVRQKINTTSFHGHYFQGQKSRGILKAQNYSYEGSFKDNKFQGYGVLLFNIGDKYQGDFKNGLYDGFGKYQTIQQGSYVGDFKNGLYNGKGIFRWREGYQYQGQYKDGQRNGKGVFRKGKQLYSGLWANNQPVNKDKFNASFNQAKISLQKVKK